MIGIKKKRIRKPRNIKGLGTGGDLSCWQDGSWWVWFPCHIENLRTLKRLHAWIGKVIAYLENKEK